MKRVLALAACGFVAFAVGCSSTKTDASAGMVADKKCCAESGTCTDKAKAAPGMVGQKKDGCCSGSAAAAGCTEKKN